MAKGILLVSDSTGLRIPLRSKKPIYHTETGDVTGYTDQVFIQFQQGGGIPPHAEQEALERFAFKGRPEEIPKNTMIGWWDSIVAQEEHGWTDETREWVEKQALSRRGLGVDYIQVVQARLSAPWPTYDRTAAKGRKTTPETLRDMVVELGVTPSDAIAYERQEKNRAEVIAAYEAIGVEPEPEVEEVAA